LPKSFLNRFNKIYLEELTQDDYRCILQRNIESDSALAHLHVGQVLEFSQAVEKILKEEAKGSIASSDEAPVNLRDLNRLLKLYRRFYRETDGDRDISLAHCVDICYLQKVSKIASRNNIIDGVLANSGLVSNIQRVRDCLQARPLVRILQNNQLTFDHLKPTELGSGRLDLGRVDLFLKDILTMQGNHTKSLQFLVDCLHTNFPLLVVTDDSHRFVKNLQTIAQLSNKFLNRILLNDRSDTTQLLGCFE